MMRIFALISLVFLFSVFQVAVAKNEKTISNGDTTSIDTIYFNEKWEKTDKKGRHFYRIIERSKISKLFYVQDFYPNHVRQMEGWYNSLDPETRHGDFTWWNEKGQKHRAARFVNGQLVKIMEWDEASKITLQQELVETVRNGVKDSIVLKAIDKPPVFDRGKSTLSNWVARHFKYPKDGRGQGEVIIQVVIDEKGRTREAKVIQSVNPILDKAALDFVRSFPRWSPAIQFGKPVKVKMQIPVSFKF